MTKLDGFESRLLQALIEIDADGAQRPGPSAAAVAHRESGARRKRRFPSRTLRVGQHQGDVQRGDLAGSRQTDDAR